MTRGIVPQARNRNRTDDRSLTMRVLPPLSYAGKMTGAGIEPATFGMSGRHSTQLSYPVSISGWGRHRTDDLRLFRPALLPAELPNQIGVRGEIRTPDLCFRRAALSSSN